MTVTRAAGAPVSSARSAASRTSFTRKGYGSGQRSAISAAYPVRPLPDPLHGEAAEEVPEDEAAHVRPLDGGGAGVHVVEPDRGGREQHGHDQLQRQPAAAASLHCSSSALWVPPLDRQSSLPRLRQAADVSGRA